MMTGLITIKTFTNPNEVAILRGRLESEGIECFLQDELTAQVIPVYSNAIGGVKLQVKQKDLAKAIEILREAGYLSEADTQTLKPYSKLDNATSEIPLLKTLRPEFRVLIIIMIVTPLIIGVIYYVTLPTKYERLTKNAWCVDRVTYGGNNYNPNSIQAIRLVGPGLCKESIDFRSNGTAILPGFNSSGVWGNWKLAEDSLQILNADTFDFVYNGFYAMDFSSDGLVMKSPKTIIYCHAEHIQLPF